MVIGTDVQENQSWPMGHKNEAMHTMLTEASGTTRPVPGSFLWAWTSRRAKGSVTTVEISESAFGQVKREREPRGVFWTFL
jgi:hypothetical protein